MAFSPAGLKAVPLADPHELRGFVWKQVNHRVGGADVEHEDASGFLTAPRP